jgi:predicted transcriptional regulator
MTITQSDLDSFHDFGSQFLARSKGKVTLEELVQQWCAERECNETIESIKRGVADAEAGRVQELVDIKGWHR